MSFLPFVSIVIAVFNGEKYIEYCLNSIMNLDYPKDRFEVIVIDGGSSDNTIEKVEQFKTIKLINSLKGTSHQRNAGIKEAKGELIAFTDSDCVVDKNWIKIGVNSFNDEKIALVGGPNITPKNSKTLEKAAGCVLSSRFAAAKMSFRYSGKGMKEADETDLIACNNIIKRELLIEIGGFNEALFPAEEIDLYYRLKEKGYKLFYNSDMIVWHHRVPLFKPFVKQIFYYGIFRAILIKNKPKIFNPLFILPTLLFFYLIIGTILITLILVGILSFSLSSSILNSNLTIDRILIYFYFGTLFIYYSVIIIESLRFSIKKKDAKLFFILPIGFFLMHMSYGLGFLKGVLKSSFI